jgi:hypothetical protein
MISPPIVVTLYIIEFQLGLCLLLVNSFLHFKKGIGDISVLMKMTGIMNQNWLK